MLSRKVTYVTRLKNLKAFTLVELIVVIVILGILAAIAVVGYNAIISKADNTSQEANASQAAKSVQVASALGNVGSNSYTTSSIVLIDGWPAGVTATVAGNVVTLGGAANTCTLGTSATPGAQVTFACP